MAVWTSFVIDDASTSTAAVRRALVDLAPDPRPDRPSLDDTGVIVFDRLTEAVLASVQAWSRGGSVRILAIATSRSALDERGSWPLLDAGASDVLIPTGDDRLSDRVAARLSRWTELDELVRSGPIKEALAGGSDAWIMILREIVEVATFSDAPLLLIGESGTGKDAVARTIHELDRRSFSGSFVRLDCRTIDGAPAPPPSPNAEAPAPLAGHGIISRVVDLDAEMPSGGTLYLDEVSALPPTIGRALLRASTDANTGRQGEWPSAKIRLICSTGEDGSASELPIAEAIAPRTAARFRLPPLRERRDDVPVIAEQLLRRFLPDLGDVRLDAELASFLAAREYPTNVHDLVGLVRAIGARHSGPGAVTLGALPPEERRRAIPFDGSWHGEELRRVVGRAVDAGASLKTIGDAARDAAVRIALDRDAGDVRRAARRLATSPKTIASRDPTTRTADAVPIASAESPRQSPIVEVPDSAVIGTEDSPADGALPSDRAETG